MASEATTEHEAGSEEKDQQPHIDERVCCDYYISARGCVKVPHATLTAQLRSATLRVADQRLCLCCVG